MIIAHISGLTYTLKQKFINSLSSTKYSIIDLDDYTDKIMDDNTMIALIEKYNFNISKSKDNSLTKIQIRQHLVKSREINLKINAYWKKQMEFYINELGNSSHNKTIILIGYLNFFRNIRIFLNLDVNTKIYVNINVDEYSKETIATNIEMYKNDIINGTFDLDLINKTFLVNRRNLVTTLYEKNGYQAKEFTDTINFFDNSLKYNDLPTVLYYASYHLYKKNIPIKPITAYTDEWIAIASLMGKDIVKGYVDNDYQKPFVQEQEENTFKKFNKKIYVYAIINTLTFVPIYSKNYIYKYKSNHGASIGKMMEISNGKNKLIEIGVKLIEFNELTFN